MRRPAIRNCKHFESGCMVNRKHRKELSRRPSLLRATYLLLGAMATAPSTALATDPAEINFTDLSAGCLAQVERAVGLEIDRFLGDLTSGRHDVPSVKARFDLQAQVLLVELGTSLRPLEKEDKKAWRAAARGLTTFTWHAFTGLIHSSHIELTIDGKPASDWISGLTVPTNIETERKKGPLKPFLKLQTKIYPCSRELAYDEDL